MPLLHGPSGPVVLEGPKGTELQRMGRSVYEPWWTNEALLHDDGREQLRGVHRAYREAGADLVTAYTFRTNIRALQRAGADEDLSRELVSRAVSDARSAVDAGPPGGVVAASITTVEDCYRPDLVPTEAELRDEHGWLSARLAEEKVELVIAETINTVREGIVIAESFASAGLPVWVSFVCQDGGRLLSGETTGEAARAVAAAGAEAVLVNCTAMDDLDAALSGLAEHSPVPIGAYPNLEDRSGIEEWTPVDRYVPVAFTPEEFAAEMTERIKRYDLGVVGGCCGARPEHIAALRSGVTG